MTSCDRIVPLFSLHLEGESSPAEDALVRAHLLDCPECRQELTDLKGTLALVRALPTIDAPEGFEAQVLLRLHEARVAVDGAAEESVWEREGDVVSAGRPTVLIIENRWWEHWIPRFAAAAAAAAVVALALVGGQRVLRPGVVGDPELATISSPDAVSSPVGSPPRDGSRGFDAISGSGVGTAVVSGGARSVDGRDGSSPAGSSQSGLPRTGDAWSGGSSGEAPLTASVSSRSASGRSSLAEDRAAESSRHFDDLRSLFPDIPPEVIRAMPLNGETYASDRLIARPGTVDGGAQVLAPVEYRSVEPVYIYR